MFEFREIYKKIEKDEIERVKALLAKENLSLEQELDRNFGLYDDDLLIATASVKGNTFRCIAVDEKFKGSSVINMLMTKLIQVMQEKRIFEYALFTKPEMANSFKYFGFSKVMAAEDVVLMTYPEDHFKNYLKSLEESFDGTVGAIVMNGNPFTNGHRYLIDKARLQVDNLIVFVVEENLSVFKFNERFKLIKDGTSDLSNVHIMPSGPYIISQSTFPGYFLNGKNKSKVHGQLDLKLFGKEICKTLKISKRFVGTEPYCENTALYNEMMKKILPKYGVEVIEIERLNGGGSEISASRIRQAVRENSLSEVKAFVPPVTYEFLSNNMDDLKIRLIENVGRH